MRKVLMMSALALAVAGCANQPDAGPQVRDLSDARRAVESTPQYTVEAGDTLYGIAWEHDMDYRGLAALNDIVPPYNIYPGQTIQLREGQVSDAPARRDGSRDSQGAVATGLGANGADVAPGEQEMDWLLPDESAIERNQRIKAEREAVQAAESVAVAQSQQTPNGEAEVAAKTASQPNTESEPEPQTAEPESKPEPQAEPSQVSSVDRSERTYTPAETIDWQWPVEGEVVSAFSEGQIITAGIDIAGEKGQPVKAAGPGIVVYAGSGVRGYGNLVLLKHNDAFLTAYAHNDNLRVSENDVVKAGETIATMGDSDAEDVRLHFEVRKDGQPQDPLNFLPSRN
ncbi:peptidoglycan DD-metalloendopeptidase family protein [Halomonas llamarensis]|uniref:Peptidoglycan DD-metalloendopeptidase family protein n=1 Tax=Halomonas llamarensis TaxID=2945104 RepID=A0ABT0SNU2_9GAMM|nr:peptidoglycan DD-metalloendopeptidase family protein [Halomonas llamarensis]MCL7929471.1 peptidoglycan DD-metalloendopeptidase family protein [Halomonas llamarensis]